MKILIFTEGTILMHEKAAGHTREEIVQQSFSQEEFVYDFASYIPIGNAAKKIQEWKDSGHEICYLTSRRKPEEISMIQKVLDKNGFPKGELFYRKDKETYAQVAEKIMPDVLIEDDCESEADNTKEREEETTYYLIDPDKKKHIRHILVEEFGGIDDLQL